MTVIHLLPAILAASALALSSCATQTSVPDIEDAKVIRRLEPRSLVNPPASNPPASKLSAKTLAPRHPAVGSAGTPGTEVRVLYLGDSLSMGAFGRTLDGELRRAGLELYTSVAGGASPYYWLREYPPVSVDISYWEKTPAYDRRVPRISAVPKVEALLERFDPEIVIVQTGTNLYAPLRSTKRSKADNSAEIESLLTKMTRAITDGGNRRCYWVSPPDAHVGKYPRALQNEMLEQMQRVAGPAGRVFNSFAVTRYTEPYPQSDGIHYGPGPAKEWALAVSRDFVRWAGNNQKMQ